MDFTQKASDYAAFTDHSTKTKALPHPQDNLRLGSSYLFPVNKTSFINGWNYMNEYVIQIG